MWAHILLLYCFDQSSVIILIIIIISCCKGSSRSSSALTWFYFFISQLKMYNGLKIKRKENKRKETNKTILETWLLCKIKSVVTRDADTAIDVKAEVSRVPIPTSSVARYKKKKKKTWLAAASQVKRAAVTIIPPRQKASATKCCCQPRGLISLARVALIITCHYQFWLHLLTGLSACVYCTLQWTG